ncbi:VOC family protein [Fusibacter bizertensis]
MQKIIPHLWFEKEGREAAELYVSLFDNSHILDMTQLSNTPSGTVELITLKLENIELMFLTAGPFVMFNPSVSFLISCASMDEVDYFYNTLAKNGSELMPLGKYDFSDHYAWVLDRYGISWQIMLTGKYSMDQKITPTMMFVGKQCGRAEEAATFYASLFKDSKIDKIERYKNASPDVDGTILHLEFTIDDLTFSAMDSAYDHAFTFNESISFILNCDTQEEIDYYWDALSADPLAEQCGWLKDKFGFSWQVTPTIMHKMLQDKDMRKISKVTEAFLKMKKFNIATLIDAYNEK